jgi:Flp pilus assembly protein TadG
MKTVRVRRGQLRGRKESFIADQRGVVAFEMPFVTILLIFSLLLPLADVAIAGFQYISAWQALRAFGQSIQYAPPPDVTNPSAWTTSASVVAKANATSPPISNIQIICADNSACSATNAALPGPKYYSYTTTVTLAPMVLRSVLCTSGNANPCAFTLPYSERFQ